MRGIALLENPIRSYAWGSRVAIARFRGAPAPSPGPEAELWLGAHPSDPSWVVVDGRRVSLVDLVAREPAAVLGPRVLARFGPRLPFLVKLLAAATPLSIQAHPSEEQARAGFDRESALGIALDDDERSYRDPSHKPELLCALEPFDALVGFRTPDAILALAERLGVRELCRIVEESLAGTRPLAELLRALSGLERSRRSRLVLEAAEAAASIPDPALAWVPRLAELHPGDAGALAPVFLNHRVLAAGEALFVPPGELHSYLRGFAIEVTASSDNVLRGGLTRKRVDLDELLRVGRFEAGAPAVLRAEPAAGGGATYRTPAAEFELSVLRVDATRGFSSSAERDVEILLCMRGRARIEAASGPLELVAGRSCIAPAAAGAYRIEGEGEIHRVRVPAEHAEAHG